VKNVVYDINREIIGDFSNTNIQQGFEILIHYMLDDAPRDANISFSIPKCFTDEIMNFLVRLVRSIGYNGTISFVQDVQAIAISHFFSIENFKLRDIGKLILIFNAGAGFTSFGLVKIQSENDMKSLKNECLKIGGYDFLKETIRFIYSKISNSDNDIWSIDNWGQKLYQLDTYRKILEDILYYDEEVSFPEVREFPNLKDLDNIAEKFDLNPTMLSSILDPLISQIFESLDEFTKNIEKLDLILISGAYCNVKFLFNRLEKIAIDRYDCKLTRVDKLINSCAEGASKFGIMFKI